MEKIIRNAAGCLLCGDVIESETVHDFKSCSCGNLSVDGGLEYSKRSVMLLEIRGLPTYLDLSESE